MGVSAAGNNSIATYRDFRKLLDNKDIDAVIVATNDHWHCLCTIHGVPGGQARVCGEAAGHVDR